MLLFISNYFNLIINVMRAIFMLLTSSFRSFDVCHFRISVRALKCNQNKNQQIILLIYQYEVERVHSKNAFHVHHINANVFIHDTPVINAFEKKENRLNVNEVNVIKDWELKKQNKISKLIINYYLLKFIVNFGTKKQELLIDLKSKLCASLYFSKYLLNINSLLNY